MKKLLVAVALVATGAVQAQFYVSASGGYAWGVPSTKVGEENVQGNKKVNLGTFGEGFNTQLRAGYFFNKTWGLDVSVGYLHGADQAVQREVSNKNLAGTPYTGTVDGDVKAHGRAFGLALSVIYNFTDNFYGRFGLLTKVGGKTVALANSVTTLNQDIPALALASTGALPVSVSQGVAKLVTAGYTNPLIKAGSKIETSYQEDFKGKVPFGTIAALGYKYNVTKNISLFAEIEYMNIGVKRDYSSLKNFDQTATLIIADGTNTALPQQKIETSLKTLDGFTNGAYTDLRGQEYFSKTTYVNELSASETNRSKKLTEKASYSSLGLNFGVTYSF